VLENENIEKDDLLMGGYCDVSMLDCIILKIPGFPHCDNYNATLPSTFVSIQIHKIITMCTFTKASHIHILKLQQLQTCWYEAALKSAATAKTLSTVMFLD
jgi:hypothetical protein